MCHALPKGTINFWKNLYETSKKQKIQAGKLRHRSRNEFINTELGLLDPIDEDEIKSYIEQMRDGASGLDGIQLETVKRMNTEELSEWFNLFLLDGTLPKSLKKFRTTLIHKVAAPELLSEYRPISVGSMIKRLFSGIMARRLSRIETNYCQRDFKPIEICAIQSYTLRAIVDEAVTRRRSLSYVFLDVQKTFDSVTHSALKSAYLKANLPKGLNRLLNNMYKGNTTTLTDDEERTVIQIKQGVLQGDPLSPLIFNLVMDAVVDELATEFGARLGNERIKCLLFADDAVLFAETPEGLQKDLFTKDLSRFGLQVNGPSCAAVHIKSDGKNKKWYVAQNVHTKVNGRKIKTLKIGECFKHLGLVEHQQRRR